MKWASIKNVDWIWLRHPIFDSTEFDIWVWNKTIKRKWYKLHNFSADLQLICLHSKSSLFTTEHHLVQLIYRRVMMVNIMVPPSRWRFDCANSCFLIFIQFSLVFNLFICLNLLRQTLQRKLSLLPSLIVAPFGLCTPAVLGAVYSDSGVFTLSSAVCLVRGDDDIWIWVDSNRNNWRESLVRRMWFGLLEVTG